MISNFRNVLALGLLLTKMTTAFSPPMPLLKTPTSLSTSNIIIGEIDNTQNGMQSTNRRSILQNGITASLAVVLGASSSTAAAQAAEEKIPMITLDEFLIILRDSARSIQRVEFSGPKAETIRVRLIDGTSFGISDIIESPTDPRSPLKVQAACRESKGTCPFMFVHFLLSGFKL